MFTRSTRILKIRAEDFRDGDFREEDYPVESDRPRQLGAGGASLAFHLLIILIAIAAGSDRFAEMWRILAGSSGADEETTVSQSAKAPKTIAIETVTAADLSPAHRGGGAAADALPPDLGIHLSDADAMLKLRGFEFDVGKLLSRASMLFPFLTREWSFEPPTAARRPATAGLANPFAPRDGSMGGQPLTLADDELQTLIDSAWSRRARWEPFQPIAALANFYSPDEGRVPVLLREYVAQNGLQPYVDPGIRDPRLWSQLGLVADHELFLRFISRYAEQHPSTKATTELLFLADKLALASVDALETMMEIDPPRDLRWTRESNRGAFYALISIRQHYGRELRRRGLTSRKAIADYFDSVRLSILDTIVRTTPDGYRSSDARFLMGEIYWRQRQDAKAREVWRAMRVEPGSTPAVAALLSTIGVSTHGRRNEEPDRINRILDAERGRWIAFSYDRLRRFGYRFDTY